LASHDGPPQPIEQAQLVWRRAVRLSTAPEHDGRTTAVLDLLRTARHDLSTMRHALTLGRTRQQISPGDTGTRGAVELLVRTIGWLGNRTDPGEVGTAAARNTSTEASRT